MVFDPNKALRERSGEVNSDDRLVTFFYLLIRDHLDAGTVEKLVREVEADSMPAHYTNGWLATYAKDLAGRAKVEGS